MKKIRSMTFLIGLLVSFVGYSQVPTFDWLRKVKEINADTNISYTLYDVVIDSLGNSYGVGSIDEDIPDWGIYPRGVYLVKYDAFGNKVWAKEYYTGMSETYGGHIKLDAAGNIYIAGQASDGITLDAVNITTGYFDFFVAKFNPNGMAIWGRGVKSDQWGGAGVSGLGLDAIGNIYVSGAFNGRTNFGNGFVLDTPINTILPEHMNDQFLAKYNPQGNILWVKQMKNRSNDGWTGNELAVDIAGNSYLVGFFKDSTFNITGMSPLISSGGTDMYWAKFDTQGNVIWKKRAGGIGDDLLESISLGVNGTINVTGSIRGLWINQPPVNIDGFSISGRKILAQIDRQTGGVIWIKNGGGQRISSDKSGHIYTSAEVNLNMGGSELISKYDNLGNTLWEIVSTSKVYGIAHDNAGDMRICGFKYENTNVGDLGFQGWGGYLAKLGINNSINGTIRHMTSGANCADTTGAGLPYFVVKMPQGYTITNEEGKYRLAVPRGAGNYTLQSAAPQDFVGVATQVCPIGNTHTANFPFSEQPQGISEKNFGYNIIDCHKLIVNISSNRRRYCEENTTVVSYRNVGVSTAANAYVLVKFPEHVTPQSSTLAWSSFDAATRTYRFELGNIVGNSNGSFTITDKTACDNIQLLGLTQCTEATIFPASSCPPPSNWNGASVGVYGKCLGNGVVRLGIYNETAAMSDSVSYRVYLDSLLVGTKKVKLAASDTVKMQVLAFGKTVRLEVEQVANHPTEQSVSVTVEGCVAANNSVSQGFVNKFSQPNTASSKTQCLEIRGSYDPNDKQVFPKGFTAQHIVAPNTKLEYLIRFQNMGTDTAFAVVVVDTLSEHFDLESLEIGAASHPFKLEMQTRFGRTYLRWEFPNIVLPHKAVNDLKSQGFVQFRIKPLANKPLGTQVRNKAGIYFDYNPAIITNETLTTFDNITFSNPNLGNVITSNAKAVNQSWSLYPNPAKGGTFVTEIATNSEITVTDVLGKALYSNKLSAGKHEIRLPEATSGVYFVRVSNAQGVGVKKLVVE